MTQSSFWSQMKGIAQSLVSGDKPPDWWAELRSPEPARRVAAAGQLAQIKEDFWGDAQRKLAAAALDETDPAVRSALAEALKAVVENVACQKGSPALDLARRTLDDAHSPPGKRLEAFRLLKAVWSVDAQAFLQDAQPSIRAEAAKLLGAKTQADAERLRQPAREPDDRAALAGSTPLRHCPLPPLPPGSNWTVFEDEDGRDQAADVSDGYIVMGDSLAGPDIRRIDSSKDGAFYGVRMQPPPAEPNGTPFQLLGFWTCHGCKKEHELKLSGTTGAPGSNGQRLCSCGQPTLVGWSSRPGKFRDHYAYAAAILSRNVPDNPITLRVVRVVTPADQKRSAIEMAARVARMASDQSLIQMQPHDQAKSTRRALGLKWLTASGAALALQASDFPRPDGRVTLHGTRTCHACGETLPWQRYVLWIKDNMGVQDTCPHCKARIRIGLRVQEYDTAHPPVVWVLAQPEGFRAEILRHPIKLAITSAVVDIPPKL